MPKQKRIRITKKIKKQIVEKVSEGMTVAEVCKAKDMPHPKSVYRAELNDEDFHQEMTIAYELFFQAKLDELEHLSKTDSKELYPHIDDFRERAEARRIRIDTLKFELGKMAPILSKRKFSSTQKVEHSGEVHGPQIVVQSYAVDEYSTKESKSDDKKVH